VTLAELELQLAAARAEASEAAEQRLRAALAEDTHRRLAEALTELVQALNALQATLTAQQAVRATASRELALALAHALVPRAMALAPLADIEAMLRQVVARLDGVGELRLALPPALAKVGGRSLRAAIAAAGYQGSVQIAADPALAPGAARLAWQDGLAERDPSWLARAAQALVERWLPAAEAEEPDCADQPAAAKDEGADDER
jgi:flagellar assembly protein FliH